MKFKILVDDRRRYSLIDYKSLMDLLNFDSYDELKRFHREWVEESLIEKEDVRDNKWTESIAIGSKQFIEKLKEKLGFRARSRKVKAGRNASFQLREEQSSYGGDSSVSADVVTENTFLWDS